MSVLLGPGNSKGRKGYAHPPRETEDPNGPVITYKIGEESEGQR